MLSLTSFRVAALASFVFLASGSCHLCKSQSANYEAANWSTRLLDRPEQIKSATPPGIAQSKTELQSIKERMGKLDEKKLGEIKYWNAGAPSYRWNQVVLGLISQKQEVL